MLVAFVSVLVEDQEPLAETIKHDLVKIFHL